MLFKRTFTFKTRRKSQMLALLLTLVSHVYATNSSIPCPEHCTCYSSERGVTASCTNVFWNATIYTRIHELVMRPARDGDSCYIPEDASKVFPELYALNLSNCSMSYILSESFKNLMTVDTIDLSNNHISDFSPTVFTRNRRLRYVNLQNNPLNVTAAPLLESSSLYELNLDSCNIEKISRYMFRSVPELKYLTLSNNRIRFLKDDSLPSGLKSLNLANNNISNVPTDELIRLKLLTEINLSGNPVNCTCQLMGYQNWVSGRGVVFINVIKCAHPAKYAGVSLINIPEYNMCDAQVENEPTSAEQCTPNQICSNQILPTDEGYLSDQPNSTNESPDAVYQQDEIIPVDQKRIPKSSDDVEGSGDDPNGHTDEPDGYTDSPDENSSTESTSTSSTTISSTVSGDNSQSSIGVEKYKDELDVSLSGDNTTQNLVANTTTSPMPANESDSTMLPPVTQPSNDSTLASTTERHEMPANEFDTTMLPPATQPSNENTLASTTEQNETTSESSVAESEIPSSPTTSSTTPVSSTDTHSSPEVSSSSSESPASVDNEPITAGNDISRTSEVDPTTSSESPTTGPKFADNQTASVTGYTSSSEHTTVIPVEGNDQQQEKWRNTAGTLKKEEMLNYIVPTLAVVLVLLICLAVYCSQYATKMRNWKSEDSNVEGSELQEVSLLSDKPLPAIVKHSNKYPDEKTCQTERLMNEAEDMMNGNLRKVNANDDQHSNETMDCCKLSNGQSAGQNVPEKVECTIVKVTTLPDSVPKTPIIRNV